MIDVSPKEATLTGSQWKSQWSVWFRITYTSLLVIGYGVVFVRQLLGGLEFDESINLTVVRNLALGNGYATNQVDGYGEVFTQFDPIVSTGPTVLVPSALLWAITDGNIMVVRLIPLALFLLYVISLFMIFWRMWGIPAALCAISVPLLFNLGGTDLFNHGLSVGRFIGEFAAVAFTVLAIRLFMLKRDIIASFVLGLAVLTKLNWLLIAVCVLLIWQVARRVSRQRFEIKRTLGASLALIAPLALFELYKLAALGLNKYTTNTQDYIQWLSVQGGGVISEHLLDASASLQERFSRTVAASSNKERLLDLFGLLAWPGLTMLVAALALLAINALRSPRHIGPVDATPQNSMAILLSLTTGGLVVVVWWVFGSVQGSARLGIPFWLLVGPVLATAVYVAFRQLMDSVVHRVTLRATITAFFGFIGAGLVAIQIYALAIDSANRVLRDEQRAAADALMRNGTQAIPTSGIWTNPELQLLTGLPTSEQAGIRNDDLLMFTSTRALLYQGEEDARIYLDACGEVLHSSRAALICRKPEIR